MFRIYLFIGGCLCAAAVAPLIVIYKSTNPNFGAIAQQFGLGMPLLLVATLMAVTTDKRYAFGTASLNIAGIAFSIQPAIFLVTFLEPWGVEPPFALAKEVASFAASLSRSGASNVLVIMPPLIGSIALMVSATSFHAARDDASTGAVWVFVGAVAYAATLFLQFPNNFVLTIFALISVLIGTTLKSTEHIRSAKGAIAINVSALLFLGCAATMLVSPDRVTYRGPMQVHIEGDLGTSALAPFLFLGAWIAFWVFVSSLDGKEDERESSKWFTIVKYAGVASPALIIFFLASTPQIIEIKLILYAAALFVSVIPLLITAALLAGTEEIRGNWGTALLEVSASAFAGAGFCLLATIFYMSQSSFHPAPVSDKYLMHPLAWIVMFAAGWAMIALASLGLKTRG